MRCWGVGRGIFDVGMKLSLKAEYYHDCNSLVSSLSIPIQALPGSIGGPIIPKSHQFPVPGVCLPPAVLQMEQNHRNHSKTIQIHTLEGGIFTGKTWSAELRIYGCIEID